MVTGGGHTRACHARPSNHWLPRFLSRFWFADVTRHSRVPSALTKYGASRFRPVVASANQNAATTSTRYARPRRDHGTIFWVNPGRARFREASVRLATQEAWLLPVLVKRMHVVWCIVRGVKSNPCTTWHERGQK